MNIQIQHFDRILIVELAGLLVEPDLLQVAGFINTMVSKLSAVILDIHKADMEPEVASTVSRLKKQYEKSKIRFLIASPEFIGADSGSKVNAVALLNSPEGARVLEIFAQEKELALLKKESEKSRAELLAILNLKEGAEPLPKNEVSRALHELEERNKQLLQLFKTLSSEIHHLQSDKEKAVMPGGDNPAAVRVSETKRRALDIIKSTKVLD